MAVTFEQFFAAISKQESGGNYNAVGVWVSGDRAYGKYQVMGNNIPSWTKAYYGKSLTPQQFLNSPAAQEAVARGKLQSYWNKYGARGAASAWYSGNASLSESTKPQPGGPSIKEYVDSVLNHAAGFPAGGSSSSTTKAPSQAKEVPMAKNEAAEEYGFVLALFESNKELKALFDKAVKGGWTAAKFQAELRDTKWFKTRGKSEREYLTLQYGDPATAKQKMDQAKIQARQFGNQLGIVESDYTLKKIETAAYNMVAKGWTEDQVRNYLGQYVYFGNGQAQGEGGEAFDSMREYSYAMGVKNSDSWYADRARNIARGMATIQDYEAQIRKQAIALFPGWKKQLEGGQTVSDLASPYFQSMSSILELPGGSVNLFDPTIKKALQYKDPKTAQQAVKPLWQFENELRNDSRWKQTKNAQDSIMQTAHQVLADFGVAY